MKHLIHSLLIILLINLAVIAQGAVNFDDYFIDKTMRIDYYHTGDAKNETIALDHIYRQGSWAGSQTHLIDPFNNGRYYIKIYDRASNTLIFSKGFDSYFGEYQTSAPAEKGIPKTYQESALIPYPKNEIIFALEKRNPQKMLVPLFNQTIDPDGVEVIREPLEKNVLIFEPVKNGDSHRKVDLAFVGEGYTAAEKDKFEKDLQSFTNSLFQLEPYKSHQKDFNIYGVLKYSEQSGCDEPTHGIYKNTAVNATFNSLGSERYLLTEDNKSLRDIASHVPYDAVVIMVNQNRYGGGGIYNFYCTFTTDNQWHEYLFLHEFGHSFTGLADEYYTSSVAYNDFYPRGVEPTKPNITALLDPGNLKWKEFVDPGIAIPTPWEKKEFDELDMAYQKTRQELNEKIAKSEREGAPEDQIREMKAKSEKLSRENAREMDNYLQNSKYYGKVGAYEGAGYSSEGLYRPMIDCIMFSKGKKPFCKVCENAIREMIKHYSE